MSWNVLKKPPMLQPSVPIVGLPFEVTGLLITGTLVCKCDGQRALLVASNAPTSCPACKKLYSIAGIQWQQGQPPQLQILGMQPDDSAHTGAEESSSTQRER